MSNAQQIAGGTTPTGRLIWGDPYTPNDKNFSGQPLMSLDGKPRVEYVFGVAIPKTVAQWWDEPWGKIIFQAGYTAFPNAYQNPKFSWKIVDGDSRVPNEKGNVPADQEGNPGHWILRFGSSFAPGIYTLVGQSKPVQLVEKDAIQPGYFVQVAFTVDGNRNANKPGVFLNHTMLCLIAYGPVIARRNANPDQAGFGHAGALPAGATTAPAGGFAPAAMPGPTPTLPAMPTPPGIVPHPTILAGPTPPPPAAPAAPVRAMTALAAGATYESFIAKGWTDALLVQHGYMQP